MWRRYTLVQQNDRSDCGAAALATVAHHHAVAVDLEQVRELTRTDQAGTSLLDLKRAASRLGFVAKAIRGSYKALAEVSLPAIIHLRSDEGDGHFVVLFKIGRRGVVIGDPASDVQSWTAEFLRRHWTGNVLVLTPDPLFNGRVSPEKTGRWGRFWTLARPHRSLLVESIICALFMTLLAVSTSYFVRHLVDSVLVRNDRPLLNALGCAMVVIVVFRTIFGVLRQYLLAHIGRKIDLTLLSTFAAHVLRLPLRFFETRRAGEILSRVNDAAKLRDAINGIATTTVVDGVLVGLVFAVLAYHDLPLAAAVFCAVAALLVTVALHHPAARRGARNAMENGAELASHLIEDVGGVETFKSCGAEPLRTSQGESRIVGFVESVFALQKIDIRVQALSTGITGLAGICVLWVGGHRVIDGALTVGELLFFFTLLSSLLEPLNRLATVNLQIQDALVAIDRLFQILDQNVESLESDKLRFTGLRREIRMQSVGFRYAEGANILEDIDIRIAAGKTVAIVGESGSGKSTLLKLLLRFYTPGSGHISVDGVNLEDFDLQSLRSGIGVVPQDPFICSGTLRENIALANPGATHAEIVAAARDAGLEEFIAALPDRFDTLIGERGANLSGGQRQRIAIARVLLAEPDIVIFDEATSHLDIATERAIQRNLKRRLAGKTVILVAHRLSTIRDADEIYVLEAGRIAESGTHAQLIDKQGRYATLRSAQTNLPDECTTAAALALEPETVSPSSLESKV